MKIPLDRGPLAVAVPLAVRALLGLLHWTTRIESRGVRNLRAALDSGRPVVFATWHGAILSTLICRRSVSIPRLLTMVSRSRDGELATRVAGPLGGDFVRASSSKGATAGVLEFRRAMARRDEAGAPAAVHFLDGPRGPRRKAKPGIVHLARAAGALVVPVEFGASRFVAARSWDRHLIPFPFSRIVMNFGAPLDFGVEDDDELARRRSRARRGADGLEGMDATEEADGTEPSDSAARESLDQPPADSRDPVALRLAELEHALATLARETPLYVEIPDVARSRRAPKTDDPQ